MDSSLDYFALDQTPLHNACLSGDISVIEALLKDGADPNVSDSKGRSPLHLTICGGWGEEAALKLLESGKCDVNFEDYEDRTPLHWAAQTGNVNVFKLLIMYGADINLSDNEGRTPLDLALTKGECEIIEILLERGAFYPGAIPKALMTYSEHCDSECITMLLPYVFDVNEIRNEFGETALHLCIGNYNYFDLPQVLLEAGANIDALSTSKDTPLHLAFRSFMRVGDTDLITLLNWLPDINKKNSSGQTPLEMSLNHMPRYENYLTYHVCKLYAAGMLKSWKLEMSIESLLFPLLSLFYQSCTREVNRLKDSKIQDITLYSLLGKPVNALVGLLRNKSVQRSLTDEFIDLLNFKYPIYGNMIRNKLKFALTRALLIESSRCFFTLLNKPNFPIHCIDLIFFYLTNQELKALSKVCE